MLNDTKPSLPPNHLLIANIRRRMRPELCSLHPPLPRTHVARLLSARSRSALVRRDRSVAVRGCGTRFDVMKLQPPASKGYKASPLPAKNNKISVFFFCPTFAPPCPERLPSHPHHHQVPSRVELPKQERVSPKVLRKSLEFQRKKTYFFSGTPDVAGLTDAVYPTDFQYLSANFLRCNLSETNSPNRVPAVPRQSPPPRAAVTLHLFQNTRRSLETYR
jgi:hypothetical protein